MGRVTGTIAPDPDGAGPLHYAAVRNTYDAAGRLTKIEKGELSSWQSEAVAPSSWSGFTVFQTLDTAYDTSDRKVQETLSAGGTVYTLTQYSYDAVGRPECIAVRMTAAHFASPPASACTQDPSPGSDGPDRIVHNAYDPSGALVKVTEGYGSADQADERVHTFTPNGKIATLTDGEGNVTSFVYDGFDRLSQVQFPSTVKGAGKWPRIRCGKVRLRAFQAARG
jgi:YD repeat-containing protein